MLLEGIVKHLPRSSFHVTICPINAPGKRLAPSLAIAADDVVRIPTKMYEARSVLQELR